jgi:uncharacterized protein YdaU (DUF1376 family)
MHYYSHHIGDFQRDTASLSDADTLAYLRLIWMYYDTELPLPNEPEKLAFKIGAVSDRVAMILQNYFYLDNNAWRHKRCDEELAKIYKASQIAKDKANKRWGKAAAMLQHHKEHVDLHNAFGELLDSQSNATAMLQHNHSNAAEPKNDATHIPINPIKKQVAVAVARPNDVDEKVWKDFLALRKAKAAPLTETALEGIRSQAIKAELTINQALQICCARGWQGFNANWVKDEDRKEVEVYKPGFFMGRKLAGGDDA